MYCFSLFCRLCFRRDCKLLNLYTKDDDNITFCEKLKSCIPEIINEEDRVPNFVCDNCCLKLKKGYEFKIMCIKNHIALREYAKHLLKYMENPTINQELLNIKLTHTENESNSSETQEKQDSDTESIPSKIGDNETLKPEPELPAEIPNIDEPLALVKVPKVANSPLPISSSKVSEEMFVDVKSESYSDDSSDYQCEDLSKKPRLVIDEDRDGESNDGTMKYNLVPKDFSNIANIQSDNAMKFLKIEYSDKDENSRNENTSSVDHPKNLSIADSETDQEDHCKWNTSTTEEPSKKMKTRTKDKYRIVYTENQRLELEKEFMVSRYITTSRKMQLSTTLNLSQRQIKIWFQNRRAKERKQVKRSVEQLGCENDSVSETAIKISPTMEQNINSIPKSEDILPEIMEIQNALFLLKQQQELRDNLQQNKDPRDGFDELYKIKKDLLHKRLQVLLQKQNEISPSNDVDEESASNN